MFKVTSTRFHAAMQTFGVTDRRCRRLFSLKPVKASSAAMQCALGARQLK